MASSASMLCDVKGRRWTQRGACVSCDCDAVTTEGWRHGIAHLQCSFTGGSFRWPAMSLFLIFRQSSMARPLIISVASELRGKEGKEEAREGVKGSQEQESSLA